MADLAVVCRTNRATFAGWRQLGALVRRTMTARATHRLALVIHPPLKRSAIDVLNNSAAALAVGDGRVHSYSLPARRCAPATPGSVPALPTTSKDLRFQPPTPVTRARSPSPGRATSVAGCVDERTQVADVDVRTRNPCIAANLVNHAVRTRGRKRVTDPITESRRNPSRRHVCE